MTPGENTQSTREHMLTPAVFRPHCRRQRQSHTRTLLSSIVLISAVSHLPQPLTSIKANCCKINTRHRRLQQHPPSNKIEKENIWDQKGKVKEEFIYEKKNSCNRVGDSEGTTGGFFTGYALKVQCQCQIT